MQSPEDWTPDEVGAFRYLSEENFYFFTVFVLNYTKLGPPGGFHWWFCEELTRPTVKAQLYLMYRAAYKSTIGGIAYPLWRFAKDVKTYSHLKLVADLELGKQHSNAMRRQVEYNPKLNRLFPELKKSPTDWSDTSFTFLDRDFSKTGSSMEVRTMKQGHAGRHVSEISMDDIVNEDNFESRSEQDRLKNRLDLMWPTLDTDDVKMFGTRYADYDFWGYVISQLHPADLDVHVQPIRGTGWIDEDGETVIEDSAVYAHPEVWNDKALEAQKRKMIRKENMDPYVFMCQYFLDTKHRVDQQFKQEWLQWVRQSELPRLTYYIGVDSASGKGSSKPAMSVVGIDENRKLYVVYADSDFNSEAALIEAVFTAWHKWRPAIVSVERYAQGGHATQANFENHCITTNQWPDFNWATHGSTDKESHIRAALRPQYEFGNVFHVEDLRNGTYEKELADFPRGAYEDTLDATAYAFGAAMKFGAYHVEDEMQPKRRVMDALRRNDKVAYSVEQLAVPFHPDDEAARKEAEYTVV